MADYHDFITLSGSQRKKGQEKSPNPLILLVSRGGFEPPTR
jgi:hypothetical protein